MHTDHLHTILLTGVLLAICTVGLLIWQGQQQITGQMAKQIRQGLELRRQVEVLAKVIGRVERPVDKLSKRRTP